MAVRIRLKRMGRIHRAFYRICVMDSRTRRDGRAIEELGFYDPHVAEESKKYRINQDRAEYWMGVGALPSPTCLQIFLKNGVKVPGREQRIVTLTEDQVEEKKRAKEEKVRQRQEAAVRKAIVQPKKLSKADMRAAKRAGAG